MSQAPRPYSIPAEALVRQARLQQELSAMESRSGSLEPPSLLILRGAITTGTALDVPPWIETVLRADLVEEAQELLRASRRDAKNVPMVEALLAQLGPLALKAQQRRAARWQLDSHRVTVRLHYAKTGTAIGFDDGDLHALFLQAFRLEGLALALDLGKRPRPLLALGPPLPAQTAGAAECLDLVLRREPAEAPALLLARLNDRLPEGLCFSQWEILPAFATPIAELALASNWDWEVPPQLQEVVAQTIEGFLAAEVWPWHRGEAKADTMVDLRTFLLDPTWVGTRLSFRTPMGIHMGLNPLKALGALLDLPQTAIVGLQRTSIDLRADARLAQADRFAPKLKNMYEDAVLLAGGSNITLVDEGDDEPILLG